MIMNPSVNINGTPREQLIESRRKIADAIMAALETMGDSKPHGRDYVGRDHQYSLDRALYTERFAMLDKLRNEILDEALAIMNAGPKGGEA